MPGKFLSSKGGLLQMAELDFLNGICNGQGDIDCVKRIVQEIIGKQEILVKSAVKKARTKYLSLIEQKVEFERANAEAQEILIKEIFSGEWLQIWDKLIMELQGNKKYLFLIRQEIGHLLPLQVSHLGFLELPSGLRMGIIAAAGTILGMNFLKISPTWEPGLFIGGTIGSFLLVLTSIKLLQVNIQPIRKIAQKILIPHSYDGRHEYIVETCFQTWIRNALTIIVLGILLSRGREEVSGDKEKFSAKLIEKILDLKEIPRNELDVAVEQLVQTLEAQGFQIPETDKTFIWTEDCAQKYETYGVVNLGDKVILKRKPIIHQGKVIRKGLVVKVRRK